MTTRKPRYPKEEFLRRGQELYENQIRSQLTSNDNGKFVAIDIETGMFEMDKDDYTATSRLIARLPDAQIWLVRAGEKAAYHML